MNLRLYIIIVIFAFTNTSRQWRKNHLNSVSVWANSLVGGCAEIQLFRRVFNLTAVPPPPDHHHYHRAPKLCVGTQREIYRTDYSSGLRRCVQITQSSDHPVIRSPLRRILLQCHPRPRTPIMNVLEPRGFIKIQVKTSKRSVIFVDLLNNVIYT